MISFIDTFRKLTDVFTKNPDSLIGKFILLITEKTNEVRLTFEKIESWRDIQQAKGTTLDLIGKGWGQERGNVSDEVLRLLIMARIARNNSNGTFNNMIEVLARTLNTNPSTIKMRALYEVAEGKKAAALRIEGLPIKALNDAGLSTQQFAFLVQRVAPAGVKVESISLQGTFRMSRIKNQVETSAQGFAPVDQSRGGTLSAIYEPSEENDLPI
ncbi:hypothetical protein ABE28_009035 [Peribacillus muralis]|uniref:Uncharacterized protein n=1 Tax=Peribacillus muralis TaxID=264697 RepID=A0A1B3XMR0_9BACI|nr:hypothetical protein [Peribacillus muralis]AOH54496.1 hypothetical protein ABE28_009035 [Peribacillus muralis]